MSVVRYLLPWSGASRLLYGCFNDTRQIRVSLKKVFILEIFVDYLIKFLHKICMEKCWHTLLGTLFWTSFCLNGTKTFVDVPLYLDWCMTLGNNSKNALSSVCLPVGEIQLLTLDKWKDSWNHILDTNSLYSTIFRWWCWLFLCFSAK